MTSPTVALTVDKDGDIIACFKGSGDVDLKKLETGIETLLTASKDTRAKALGADIIEFYQNHWPEGYYHDECVLEFEDEDCNIVMDPMGEFLLEDMGWLHHNSQSAGLPSVSFEEAFLDWKKSMDPRRQSSRYPYTYADDLIRMKGPRGENPIEPKLSRADVSHILSIIEECAGISKVLLAEKLADYYLTHEDEIVQESLERASRAW